jgi:hypothetical protein
VAWVSGLLLAASKRGPLLAYLPCALGELVMDYVLAGRRCEAPWASPEQLQVSPGLHAPCLYSAIPRPHPARQTPPPVQGYLQQRHPALPGGVC